MPTDDPFHAESASSRSSTPTTKSPADPLTPTKAATMGRGYRGMLRALAKRRAENPGLLSAQEALRLADQLLAEDEAGMQAVIELCTRPMPGQQAREDAVAVAAAAEEGSATTKVRSDALTLREQVAVLLLRDRLL